MPTSPDGLLSADFLTEKNIVVVTTHGDKVIPAGVRRTNLLRDPRGTAAGTVWGYQAGTGETGTTTLVSGANDGPVTVEGQRIPTYVRRTVTAAKTGGASGPYCRLPAGEVSFSANAKIATTMHVRFSVPVTVTVQSTARNGTSAAGSVQTVLTIPANTWTRVGDLTTATGPGDGAQVFASLLASEVLPVGATIDMTGGQMEWDALTPYFDGTFFGSGTMVYYWQGSPNASISIEENAAAPASFVMLTREAPGEPTETLGAEGVLLAPGGWYTGSDNTAPMNAAVTYTAVMLDANGLEIQRAQVTVDTIGAVWGLWLKDPTDAQRNVRVEWRGIGARSRATQGAQYSPSGSPFAIVEWDGVAPEETTIQVATRTGAATAALDALLDNARVLFVQSDPSEMPTGYYYVPNTDRENPVQVVDTIEGYRITAIPLVRSEAPVGDAAPYTGGPTFASVEAEYATFQDVADRNATFLHLANPEEA